MNRHAGQGLNAGSNEKINLMAIVKGIVLSYIITIPIFAIFAIILTYTDYPENYISPVVIATTIISILIAGSTVTKKTTDKGWLNGGIVGLIYMVILFIVSSIVYNNYDIDKYVVTMGLIGVITGMIGGIMGINFKVKTHSKLKHNRI